MPRRIHVARKSKSSPIPCYKIKTPPITYLIQNALYNSITKTIIRNPLFPRRRMNNPATQTSPSMNNARLSDHRRHVFHENPYLETFTPLA
ncbi:hypothetical protein RJT34_24341 [Clitoria ternatea]|uniref:Uncharacterized protein n=1 Tax=Clitoria ternatea TaxID=43366 RepID=A0AAN9IHX8_CLITE